MEKRGTIKMSEKERDVLVVMERVKRGEMTMAEAARELGISYRQCWRRLRRYEAAGAAGLVHRLRGGSGNRSIAKWIRERVVELYRGRYEGFGPVLFAEKLEADHEIKADHAGGTAVVDKRRAVEGREEAAMRLLWMWIERYGVPKSLYTDKKNVYVPCEKDLENARLEGRECWTQFGRACSRLGIKIIRAHSPEAKGRVERANGVYQDRLVKELRLKSINDMTRANELLTGSFDDDLNRRFAIEPGDGCDYHRSRTGVDLSAILCIEQERTLSVNWTLSFENRLYRLESRERNYSPAKRKVTVRLYLDGTLHMFYRTEEIGFDEFDPGLAAKTKTPRRQRSLAAHGKPPLPSPNHPWRTPWSTKQLIKQQQIQT